MQLEPVYADGVGEAGADNGNSALGLGTINVSLEQQQLIGLRVEPIAETSSTHQVRVLGRVVADESRLYRVNAATDGYIQTVFNHTTGSLVKKDDELATFGAIEVMTAQQSFVGSTLRSPETRNEVASDAWRNQNRLLYSSRLRSLGMSEIQLKELANSLKVSDSIQIYWSYELLARMECAALSYLTERS